MLSTTSPSPHGQADLAPARSARRWAWASLLLFLPNFLLAMQAGDLVAWQLLDRPDPILGDGVAATLHTATQVLVFALPVGLVAYFCRASRPIQPRSPWLPVVLGVAMVACYAAFAVWYAVQVVSIDF